MRQFEFTVNNRATATRETPPSDILLGMPEPENIDMILLYVAILLACLLALSFEFWKVSEFGQWEPLKLTVVAVGLVISGTFLVMELRKPKS